jgi:NADH dehydrogenase/NADH:ubiquinone oxidoreductase subunit G
MSEITLQIDGREVEAKEGMTILEAAQSVGISIPTLCHHEKLEPYGACRICTVEIEARGRTNLVAACLYPVEQNLVVRTRSEKVDKTRKVLLELMLAHAPDAAELQDLARGVRREVIFIPEIASKECWNCKECFPLCPTEALQATFLLTKALMSPSPPSAPESEE